jgi:hypothetical protein
VIATRCSIEVSATAIAGEAAVAVETLSDPTEV